MLPLVVGIVLVACTSTAEGPPRQSDFVLICRAGVNPPLRMRLCSAGRQKYRMWLGLCFFTNCTLPALDSCCQFAECGE